MYATFHLSLYARIMKPTPDPFDLPPINATDLRNNWTRRLQATCNQGNRQPITRYGRPAAVLVPTWWYRAGVLTQPDATDLLLTLYLVPSNDGRSKVAELLTRIVEHAHHIMITVEGYDIAVFAPRPWADAVALKLISGAE